LDETSDAELMRRARLGEQGAFQTVVGRHAHALYRTAFVLVGSAADAEDVVQETFLGALKNLQSFEGRSSAKTWLTSILIRQAHTLRRRRRVRAAQSIHGVGDGGDGAPQFEARSTSSPGQQADRRMDVTRMLAVLSEEHREVLVLRDLEGYAYDEIAELLSLPIGTVESRIFRARQVVRERFAGYLQERSAREPS
jgi:RNA polymerase sigma-70 factor (ECF subfamily)